MGKQREFAGEDLEHTIVKRGDVYIAHLDNENSVNTSSRLIKSRPAIVISNDEWNQRSDRNFIIIPLSSAESSYKDEFPDISLEQNVQSKVMLNNMQTLEGRNLDGRKYYGHLKYDTMKRIDLELINVLGLEYLLNDNEALLKHIEELNNKVADLTAENAKLQSDLKYRTRQLTRFDMIKVNTELKYGNDIEDNRETKSVKETLVKIKEGVAKPKQEKEKTTQSITVKAVKKWTKNKQDELLKDISEATYVDETIKKWNITNKSAYYRIRKYLLEN